MNDQRMKQLRMILLLLVLLLVPGIVMSQQQERRDIRGYVVDAKNGEALPYANVIIPEYDQGTATNPDGYFVLVNVPAGTCTLKVSYIGYRTKEIAIDNQAGQARDLLTVALEQMSLTGETVEVVAERYAVLDATGKDISQMTVSPRELQILPSLGETDIFRSLRLLPGISSVGKGKGGLYIRGGTPDQNMVILDGMTIYHVDHFFGMFSAFNADAIKDVQIFKGGFPAKYGGRLSSVVELTGRKGGNKQEFRVGANFLSTNMYYSTPLWGDFGSFMITGRRSYTDIIQTSFYNNLFEYITGEEATSGRGNMPGSRGGFGGGGAFQQQVVPSFYYYDLNSKLSLNPTNRDFLVLSFYNGKDYLDKSRETEFEAGRWMTDTGEEFQTLVNKNETDWGNLGGSLKWGHQWGNRMFSNLLITGSEYASNFEQERTFNNAQVTGVDDSTGRGIGAFAQNELNRVYDRRLKLDNLWQVSRNHQLGFGIEIADIATDYEATTRDSISILNVGSQSVAMSSYLQDSWDINALYNITAGLRGTYYDQTDEMYLAPRISLGWQLTDKLKLKGAWGKYYQFINAITNEKVLEGSKDFWLTADTNIRPASSVHNILALTYEDPDYLFEIQGYYKTLHNLVEFTRRFQERADYLNYFFFGHGVARGVELLAQKKFGALKGWVSYTLGEVESTFPNLNDGEPYPAPHDRTHEFTAVGTYKYRDWTFSGTWVYSSGNPYTAPESQYFLTMLDGTQLSYIHVGDKNAYRLPDYHRLDLSVSRRFQPMDYRYYLDVGLSIYNVYNHNNVAYREYDLDVTPIVASDVLMLGFTPSLFVKLNF